MKIFITGGCGFLGSNLAADALSRGDEVTILDSLNRTGANDNLGWLRTQGEFAFYEKDVRDVSAIDEAIGSSQPDAVFHVAGQVAMTTSLEDPRLDFAINALGTFNVIDSIRRLAPQAQLVYSSTNKVYGDLIEYTYHEEPTRWTCQEKPLGFDENTLLSFHSPYGCSKGAADQYALDAHRMWGIDTVVFRHSSMYGGRQFATYDQGWIGWFCLKALEQSIARIQGTPAAPFTISGDGKQVRDVLHAKDMVRLYRAAIDHRKEASGHAFNIGGGMANSLSLLELFAILETIADIKLSYQRLPPRSSDQLVFVADVRKAESLLGWRPSISCDVGLREMMDWSRERVRR